MKILLSILLIVAFIRGYSQDTIKTKQIDLLIFNINKSSLPVHRDTLIQDRPELGLKMITYLTTIVKDNELIKYVNFVNTTIIESGGTRKISSSSTFYYNQNKLIKVEEFLIEGDTKKEANWYYSEDKPLYYTLQSEKSEARAVFLLETSKAFVKQVIK